MGRDPLINQRTIAHIAKNSIYVMMGNALSALITFIVFIYVARMLDAASYGAYFTVMAYLAFFDVVATLGITTVVVREGAKHMARTGEIVYNAMILRVITGTISLLICILMGVFIMPYSRVVKIMIVLTAPTLVINGIVTVISSIFNIFEDMKYIAIVQIGTRIVFGILVVTFMFMGRDIRYVALSYTLSALFSVSPTYFFSRKFVRIEAKVRTEIWPWILRPAIWFGVASFLGTTYSKVDVIMLSLLSNMRNVGYYVVANNIVVVMNIISASVATALFPIITKSIHKGDIDLERIVEYTIIFYVIAILIIIIMIVAAEKVVLVLYGDKYAQSIPVLQVLAWIFLVSFATIPSSLCVDALNLQKIHVFNASIMSIVNVCLNYYLIPKWGTLGAAWATLSSWLVGFFMGMPLALYFVNKKLVDMRAAKS